MDPCKLCGMGRRALYTWKCGTRLNARGSIIQSDACTKLAQYKLVIQKVVDLNTKRDDDGDIWCYECDSWNHSRDDGDHCTTQMLADLLEKEAK